MDLGLKGKTALVMGGSTGIGKAVAEALVREGARVAICSRNLENLKRAQEEMGCDAIFTCDLSQPNQSKDVTLRAIENFGRLDIVVTNTGGPQKGVFQEITLEQWSRDYQSLWLSVIESFQAALPEMKKNKYGRFLMVTSIAAKKVIPGLTTSNGLRAGLEGLAKTVASEYSKDGITFNLILPGYTNTDRLKELNLSQETVEKLVPAGRLGRPEELGDLVSFLASERAGYVTGQSIAIDGGALIT